MKTAIRASFVALLFFSMPSWGAYSCNISTASVGVLYTAADVDTNGSVTLTCTRDAADPANLTYRIKADDGANAFATDPFRRARRGASADVLSYILLRGTVVGGAAACGATSTWRAPATGVASVIQGTLAFGASLSATAVWGYCIRIRGVAGGNPAAPAAGSYTDSFNVFAQYPDNDAGALTPLVPATYTVGVTNQCVFNTFPTSMAFNYTSFSTTPQVQTSFFNLRCSNLLPWSVAVSPANAVVLGLAYGIVVTPANNTGTGANQLITLTATVPSNQAGTCATGTCTDSQAHVVTITY